MTAHQYDLIIGCDRSDQHLDLSLLNVSNQAQSSLQIGSDPDSLHQWIDQLIQAHPGARIAFAFEQPGRNILAWLAPLLGILKLTIYALNPIALRRFRGAFILSNAKSDITDCQYLAKLILLHYQEFAPWQPDDQLTQKLQHLVADRRAVVDHRTELTNRLQALLKDYFPQALQWTGEDLWRPMACKFLLRWPTLQSLQKSKPQTIREFYYAQGSRSSELIEKRLKQMFQTKALTADPSILDSYVLRMQLVVKELELAVIAIKKYDHLIHDVMDRHPDAFIFKSLPGAGLHYSSRLLAAVGTVRERYQNSGSLLNYSAIAPIRKQSGKVFVVHRRYHCNRFVRQSFHEYAGESIRHSTWAAAFYEQQRAKGSSHHTAIRALAFKWIRIIFRCWRQRVTYDEPTYLKALQKAHSPLVPLLNHENTIKK